MIAEKFDAMVKFSDQATRLKDHYDVWAISRTISFDARTLIEAARQTLANRERAIPEGWPACLTADFTANGATLKQWNACLKRTSPTLAPPPLNDFLAELGVLLGPVLKGLS